MNSEVKKKWVEALRSGTYEQGTDVLRFDNNYCCLGVLCDLYAIEKSESWDELPDGSYQFYGNASVLPTRVRVWAELESRNPEIEGKHLSDYNDDGHTFEAIADMIDEHL